MIHIVHKHYPGAVDLSQTLSFQFRRTEPFMDKPIYYFKWQRFFEGKLLSGNRAVAFPIFKLYQRYVSEDLYLFCRCKYGERCISIPIKDAIENWHKYKDHPSYWNFDEYS